MNLLLLISALLSALTGASMGVGRLQSAPAVAERSIGGAAVAPVSAAPPIRPVDELPGLRASSVSAIVVLPALAAIPLWANRRRE